MSIDWIALLGCVLGGAGITELINYLVTWKSSKLKAQKEAEEVGADVAKKNFEVNKDQSEYLLDKLNKYEREYYELNDRYRDRVTKLQNELDTASREFNEKINEKCNEIASLKSEIIYLKGIRCYNSNCMVRVIENPDKKKKEDGNNK